MKHINKESASDDLKKLFGLPPYNSPSNYCAHDSYFANSIEEKYNMSISDLAILCNIDLPKY